MDAKLMQFAKAQKEAQKQKAQEEKRMIKKAQKHQKQKAQAQTKAPKTKSTNTKTKELKQKKQEAKTLKNFIENGGFSIDEKGNITYIESTSSDFEKYLDLLQEIEAIEKKQIKTQNPNTIENASPRGIDFYNLKQFKNEINSQIEELTKKRMKHSTNENYVEMIDKKINKLYFYLQTYTAQIFDLYFDSDMQTKYNFDLMHFQIFIRNETLNAQLLYYRLIDLKKKYIDGELILDDAQVKSLVYDKTEKTIIQNLTNIIILDEIAKKDAIKFDFLKLYYRNFYKHNGEKSKRLTASRYRQYIVDRYSYLLNDTVIH